MRLARALTVAAVMAWPALAPAADAPRLPDLSTLLDRARPQTALPDGTVSITGWLERQGEATELVLSFAPEGAARLVADPGIVLRPLPSANASWLGAAEIVHADPSRPYFAPPLEVRLPVRAIPGRTVGTSIEYAYCLADRQCLFGEAVVEVPVPAG